MGQGAGSAALPRVFPFPVDHTADHVLGGAFGALLRWRTLTDWRASLTAADRRARQVLRGGLPVGVSYGFSYICCGAVPSRRSEHMACLRADRILNTLDVVSALFNMRTRLSLCGLALLR